MIAVQTSTSIILKKTISNKMILSKRNRSRSRNRNKTQKRIRIILMLTTTLLSTKIAKATTPMGTTLLSTKIAKATTPITILQVVLTTRIHNSDKKNPPTYLKL